MFLQALLNWFQKETFVELFRVILSSKRNQKRYLVPFKEAFYEGFLKDFDPLAAQFVLCQAMTRTPREMLATVKRLYRPVCDIMPSRRDVEKTRDLTKLEFMSQWKLQPIPDGLRVSLVCAVQFLARASYGLKSLEGVRIDIWGDGMMRGKTDVTRLCFRFLGLDSGGESCQSRKHVFCFAVYCVKDTRINLERNLGSFEVIGETGWLMEETRELVNKKAIVTLSGDAPYLNRLIGGYSSDLRFKSYAPLWISETIGFMQTADHSGYRTDIDLIGNDENDESDHIIRRPLPDTSLIHVPSSAYVCPDAHHANTRSVEKDLKCVAEHLLQMVS